MYEVSSYDHDGYNRMVRHDDFMDALKDCLTLASLSPRHGRYGQHYSIFFNGRLLLTVYPDGARNAWDHWWNHDGSPSLDSPYHDPS